MGQRTSSISTAPSRVDCRPLLPIPMSSIKFTLLSTRAKGNYCGIVLPNFPIKHSRRYFGFGSQGGLVQNCRSCWTENSFDKKFATGTWWKAKKHASVIDEKVKITAQLTWNETKKTPKWQHAWQMWKLHPKDQHWMMDRNLHKKAPSSKCSLKTPSPCRTFRKLRWTWGWLSEPQSLVTRKIRKYHDHGTIILLQNIHGSHGWTFPAGATRTFNMSNLDCNILPHCHSKAHTRSVFLALDLLASSQAKTISKPWKNLWATECPCPNFCLQSCCFLFCKSLGTGNEDVQCS